MKKYIFGAVLSFGLLVSPAFTQAASLTSTQIQSILSLLSAFGADQATINSVQTALNGGTPTTSGTAFCHNFNSDLTVGSYGDDVSALNRVLQSSGIDTSSNSSNFDENNAGDVVAFQSHYGIRQTGYVGPLTRGKLNALYGCNNGQQPTIITGTVSASGTTQPAPTTAVPSSSGPSVDISASPSTITSGQSSTIYWSANNATYCNAADLFSGSVWSWKDRNAATVNPSQTKTYSITCTGVGGGGSVTKSVTVTVSSAATTPVSTQPPAITGVTVNAGTVMIYGSHFDLADNYVLVDGVTRIDLLKGDATFLSFSGDTYSLTSGTHILQVMNSRYGNSNAQSFVYAVASTATVEPTNITPSVQMSAEPSSITIGQSSTIYWSASNATYCNAPELFSGSVWNWKDRNAVTVNPTQTKTYTLSCTGAGGGGTNSQSVTVTVASLTPTITGISPSHGTAGTVVTVSGTNFLGATEIDFYNASDQFVGGMNNNGQGNIYVFSSSSLQFTLSAGVANNTFDVSQFRMVTPSGGSSNAWPFTLTAAQ